MSTATDTLDIRDLDRVERWEVLARDLQSRLPGWEIQLRLPFLRLRHRTDEVGVSITAGPCDSIQVTAHGKYVGITAAGWRATDFWECPGPRIANFCRGSYSE